MTPVPIYRMMRCPVTTKAEISIMFKSCIAWDTQSLYDEQFNSFFDFFKKAGQEGIPEFGWLPLLVSSPQDMKSHQKCLCCGHGIKKTSTSQFCHLCPCPFNQAASPNVNPCEFCLWFNSKEPCYHHSIGDEATISKFQAHVTELEEEYRYLDDEEFQRRSKISLSHDEVTSKDDPNSIDFDYSRSFVIREQFETLVDDELSLRSLWIRGRLTERIARLKGRLTVEAKLNYLKKAINVASERHGKGMIIVEQAVPCILHLENRVGETIFKNLLEKSYGKWRREVGGNPDGFMARVLDIVNNHVFGSPENPAQWRVRMEGHGNDAKIPEITLPNARAQKLINNFDVLVDMLLNDDATMEEWKSTIMKYHDLIISLCRRTNFSDDDVDSIQRDVDFFP